jgi:cyclomaltodextrinase / maltogenic alpha-amylase / neopullulanase
MKLRKLSRRTFLRMFTGVIGTPYLIRASGLDASPFMPDAHIQDGVIDLLGGDADVWAWETQIRGRVVNLACETIQLTSGDNSVEAEIQGDQFSAVIPIASGSNRIVAACHQSDGQVIMSEPLTYTGRLRSVPRSVINISLEDNRIVIDGSASQQAEQDASPLTRFVWSARAGNPDSISIESPTEVAGQSLDSEANAQRLVLIPPETDGEYYIRLTVTDEAGREDTSTTYFVIENGQPALDNWDTENADWIENTVVYGVIPRNFGSEGFQSVIDRLDYLAELGINALWLAPINDSPPGDYGYAVVDYFNVDSRYGTNDDFRRMVEAAHERGIRVLMDFVPNHSSEHHPYFQDTLTNGTESPYWDFYARDESGMYTYYFDWTHLPNLNYENPEVRSWMLEAFTYWVREFDVDGFRVDVAWGIRERRPDFWPLWRDELKRIKPDVLLLAEASARDEYYFDNGYDAAYDWTSQLGHWAWENVFNDRELLTFQLNAALTNLRNGFHPDALIFRFLNNNDTGERFVTRYGVDMTRVATALLLTLPGIPCVYTGDEVGAQFQPYGDATPISWEDRFGLRDYHSHLIHLRRDTPSLHSRYWSIVELEPHQRVYGYLRYLEGGAEPLLVLLNFFDEPAEVDISLPDEFAGLAAKESFTDLVSGDTVTTLGTMPLRISMPPMSAMILS